MWNRVFLLASGFLFGWSLVRYWTVPRAQMRTHALRLGIAVAIGGAVIVYLGWSRCRRRGGRAGLPSVR